MPRDLPAPLEGELEGQYVGRVRRAAPGVTLDEIADHLADIGHFFARRFASDLGELVAERLGRKAISRARDSSRLATSAPRGR